MRERLERNGVHYYFMPFGDHGRHRRMRRCANCCANLAPDVFHVHGSAFPRMCCRSPRSLPAFRSSCRIMRTGPPRFWRRAFVAPRNVGRRRDQHFVPWSRRGRSSTPACSIGPNAQIYEIPESTSRFVPGRREEARRATGASTAILRFSGSGIWMRTRIRSPCSRASATRHAICRDLQLYCCFGSAPLLGAVQGSNRGGSAAARPGAPAGASAP